MSSPDLCHELRTSKSKCLAHIPHGLHNSQKELSKLNHIPPLFHFKPVRVWLCSVPRVVKPQRPALSPLPPPAHAAAGQPITGGHIPPSCPGPGPAQGLLPFPSVSFRGLSPLAFKSRSTGPGEEGGFLPGAAFYFTPALSPALAPSQSLTSLSPPTNVSSPRTRSFGSVCPVQGISGETLLSPATSGRILANPATEIV